jgi:predicted RNA binding protein YcfA (HicA-like mRNA interferase family)
MPKLPRVSAAAMVRHLKRQGFVEDRQRGGHLTMFRPADSTSITIPMHPGDLPVKVVHGILRRAGLSPDDLR